MLIFIPQGKGPVVYINTQMFVNCTVETPKFMFYILLLKLLLCLT